MQKQIQIVSRTVGSYNQQKSKIIQTLATTCTNEINMYFKTEILFGQVLGKLLLTYQKNKDYQSEI